MTVLKNKFDEKADLVFDTNIFLLGIDFNVIPNNIYTVNEVLEEINVERYSEKNRNILTRIRYAIDSGTLIIKHPNQKSIYEVKRIAKITGDLKVLSIADINLIALTYQLIRSANKNVILYTNDYSMENLCSEIGIAFSPLGKEGIKKKKIFEVYCPFCLEIHDVDDLNAKCERCGSKLKRRPKKF
ncbi:MAG: hypothetical protein GF317_04350 [Candidatus Lokiarchaeota archaeon]|nr:hypothetical protein [Candidatus Lokiarchaeota archaeon]MBD3199120.1 hypothetical protein [Candidatus Lokiarchaeota archaeon]